MKLLTGDYFLCRLAAGAPGALKMIGDMETDLLGSKLASIPIDRPVFVTGLARSGTTILLDLLSKLEPVGTHRYRDFPFLFSPWWWNACSDRLGKVENPVERPHRDRIRITRESPDAFEEPIWRYFFPFVSEPLGLHVLDAEPRNERFDEFFADHLRKVLLLRGKTRYVSKGNYNITRIGYLARLFPDARFVIPIRDPVRHVASLVRQHRLFSQYSDEDPRVPKYLAAAGHFEFGPHRLPISVDLDETARILDAWSAGDDAVGYAVTWRAVYGLADRMRADPSLHDRIKLVRFEDLCRRPSETFADLLRFCGLEPHLHEADAALASISAPDEPAEPAEADRVRRETAKVAARFGYGDDAVPAG